MSLAVTQRRINPKNLSDLAPPLGNNPLGYVHLAAINMPAILKLVHGTTHSQRVHLVSLYRFLNQDLSPSRVGVECSSLV
jgi:hypothetical protein